MWGVKLGSRRQTWEEQGRSEAGGSENVGSLDHHCVGGSRYQGVGGEGCVSFGGGMRGELSTSTTDQNSLLISSCWFSDRNICLITFCVVCGRCWNLCLYALNIKA